MAAMTTSMSFTAVQAKTSRVNGLRAKVAAPKRCVTQTLGRRELVVAGEGSFLKGIH